VYFTVKSALSFSLNRTSASLLPLMVALKGLVLDVMVTVPVPT
jgi:hypothetical protein